MNRKKKKIIFVGSFADKLDDDRIGGQMIACNTLINSDLNDDIDWLLLDSTAVLPIQHVIIRSFKAFKRMMLLLKYLIFNRPESALIFSASGFSFLEKGLMAHISNAFGVNVFYASRSGLILNDLKKSWKRKYIAKVFDISSGIICQSDEWKNTFMNLTEHADTDKYHVIHNWVDIDVYRPAVKEKKKQNLSLLYLGWVKDYKGIFDLIEALNDIKSKIPNLTVNICGNGDDYNKSISLCKEYGIDDFVNFSGWVDHEGKIEKLKEADIYVIPSHFEGFPNALLEAMSCGLPVIASDVGAISAAVENEKNGFLINPKRPKEISEAILRLYNDSSLREAFGDQARRTVEEKFSKQSAIQKFKNILA